jgi:hypothetical protein
VGVALDASSFEVVEFVEGRHVGWPSQVYVGSQGVFRNLFKREPHTFLFAFGAECDAVLVEGGDERALWSVESEVSARLRCHIGSPRTVVLTRCQRYVDEPVPLGTPARRWRLRCGRA